MTRGSAATYDRSRLASPKGGPRERILEGALRTFSEQGFRAASVREITDLVGVNIAAVNYYYGSKHALIQAVLDRYILPIVQARGDALDKLQKQKENITTRDVVKCLVRPMVDLSRDNWGGRCVVLLLMQTRVCSTPEIQSLVGELFDVIAHRFVEAFLKADQRLTRDKAYWRYNFALGSIMQVLADTLPETRRLEKLSGGVCVAGDRQISDELIDFICGGMQARSINPPLLKRRTAI